MRQRARQAAEERAEHKRKLEAFAEDVYGDAPVRQREVEEEEPAYQDYDELLTAESSRPREEDGNAVAAAEGGFSEYSHRIDGTPLDFSSRAARQEVQKMRAQEIRLAEQSATLRCTWHLSLHVSRNDVYAS